MKKIALALAACCAIVAIFAVHSVVPTALIVNPGFEAGKVGEAPSGWLNGGEWAGYPASLSGEHPHAGRMCGLLRSDPASLVRDYGVLSQMIETEQLKTRYVRLRLAARSELQAPDGRAYFFCRVDRSSDDRPLFRQQAIDNRAWRTYVFVIRIPEDAVRMQAGVTLVHQGKVWVDDVSLDVWKSALFGWWVQWMGRLL